MRTPQAARGNGLGALERSIFSVMGPPQLGENKAPDGYVLDAAANLCHKVRPAVRRARAGAQRPDDLRRYPAAQGTSERQVVQARCHDEGL